MKDEGGFALVIVLVFVGILSEVIISMMNSTIFASRTLQNFAAYSRYIHIANIALEQAKKDIIAGNMMCFKQECFVQGKFLKNYEKLKYRIDFLETVPCFQIENSEKKGADFFKISIKVGNYNEYPINIERTFVNEVRVYEVCDQTFKTINAGFLSWRVVE